MGGWIALLKILQGHNFYLRWWIHKLFSIQTDKPFVKEIKTSNLFLYMLSGCVHEMGFVPTDKT